MADGAKHSDVAAQAARLFVEAADEYRAIVESIARQRERLVELNNTMKRAQSAAELFDFTLPSIDLGRHLAVTRSRSSDEGTIRHFVIQRLRTAYPGPVHATALREEWRELTGHDLHEKTMGMSLYRLAKAGIARREGRRDWHYIPTEHGPDNVVDGDGNV